MPDTTGPHVKEAEQRGHAGIPKATSEVQFGHCGITFVQSDRGYSSSTAYHLTRDSRPILRGATRFQWASVEENTMIWRHYDARASWESGSSDLPRLQNPWRHYDSAPKLDTVMGDYTVLLDYESARLG